MNFKRTLKISEHDASIVSGCEQVIRPRREANTAEVAGVWREALQRSGPAHVVESARAIVVTAH